jgi:hypothetical protein
MFRTFLNSKNLTAKMLSALLVITLSGAYCLFCCQETSAKTVAESCPLHKTNHCNFAKNKSPEASETAASINLFECCGLKFNFFVGKLEKNEFSQQSPAIANNFFNFLQSVNFENKAKFTDFVYRAPLYDSRFSRVKNCVFRI